MLPYSNKATEKSHTGSSPVDALEREDSDLTMRVEQNFILASADLALARQ
jgi:hypothetical protein